MKILATESYIKGELFSRLVADVFLALGYEDPRLSIQKTGREIDVIARHRVEPKSAVGEFKAKKNPVGGTALNKFAGVLQAEMKAKGSEEVQGYFISLSGFTETAVEQELGFDPPRFVCLDGQGVQKQLVAGGVVVSQEKACEVVGRLATEAKMSASLASPPELLGHEVGWVWLCLLERDREMTHFALVHADGQPLAPAIAESVVMSDSRLGGFLGDLEYLGRKQAFQRDAIEEADRRHRESLLAELGDITLEGLPADEDAGTRRISLGDLYVPLKVEKISSAHPAIARHRPSAESSWKAGEESEGAERAPLGWILGHTRRLAILGDPGAGKSTLIKRLAVAYASEKHRQQAADDLPDVDWLPVFIRCRALGKEHFRMSFRQILDDTARRGEFPESADGFKELVSTALPGGRILLLVDGLDEIADAGDRLAFVRQLRTFLSIYPNVGLVLTSRQTGFRAVGGALSAMCDWYRLAEFDDDDIFSLTEAWHATMVGRSLKIADEARELARTIVDTDRVRRLAKNPLLLTTLLLVKRWVGDLPRKRTVLYQKAIEVLLMTWNVEAYEPIDEEEAIPQLAYVAHALTVEGAKSLSSVRLTELLNKARSQMPEVLGFARTSVKQFVDRVEGRSSLLVMIGHREELGKLVPVYEFRHLTFQEYLAAVALVEGFYDGHEETDRLVDQLAKHLGDPRWFEVLTLANVLAGRSAGEVISLVVQAADDGARDREPAKQSRLVLGRALADEVQMSPKLVASSAFAFGRRESDPDPGYEGVVAEILEGRYAGAFQERIEAAYRSDHDPSFADFAHGYAKCLALGLAGRSPDDPDLAGIGPALVSDVETRAAAAAMEAMVMAFEQWNGGRLGDDRPALATMQSWSAPLIALCEIGRPYVSYAATWALVWLGELDSIDDRSRALKALLALWRNSWSSRAQAQAAWAFGAIGPVDRSLKPLGEANPELSSFVEKQSEIGNREWKPRADRALAALTLAYYLGEPWSDAEIARRVKALPKTGRRTGTLRRLPGLLSD